MATRDVRICFIGDSFVNGTGDTDYLGWPGRLCAAVTEDEISLTCYNLGIRRNSSADILLRWKQECASRLPESCDGRMVLSCGVNDMVIEAVQTRVSFEESSSNVRQILLAANKKYKTLMVGPAPVGDADLNLRLKALTTEYAQVANTLGIPYIEVFSQLLVDQRYLLESKNGDGYHPGSYGYAAIANSIRSSEHWWFK